MSALPPKADMFSVEIDVYFVPQADIAYWLFSAETRQLASFSPLPDPPNSLQNSLRCAPHPTLGNYGTNDEANTFFSSSTWTRWSSCPINHRSLRSASPQPRHEPKTITADFTSRRGGTLFNVHPWQ